MAVTRAIVAFGDDEIISELNRAKYLFLRDISEPEENSLRIVVEEAVADTTETVPPPDTAHSAAHLWKGASPIRTIEGCRMFELTWSRYIAYLVTEELAASTGSYRDEVYTGNLFRAYSKSHFLEHVSRDTGCHFEPVLHYKVICQNHLIDVACYAPPEIRISGTRSSRPN